MSRSSSRRQKRKNPIEEALSELNATVTESPKKSRRRNPQSSGQGSHSATNSATPDFTSTSTSTSIPQPSTSTETTSTSTTSSTSGPRVRTDIKRARWFSRPPDDFFPRLERALNQRLYLIDFDPIVQNKRNFYVLGASKSQYTVSIGETCKCTCIDARMRHHCKHLIFIKHRVLKIPTNHPLIYQKHLVVPELEEIFQNEALGPRFLAPEKVRAVFATHNYRQINETIEKVVPIKKLLEIQDDEESESSKSKDPKLVQKEYIGVDCPICFEEMTAKSSVDFCRVCGQSLHGNCLLKWKVTQKNMGRTPSCPYCRAEWISASDKKQKKLTAQTRDITRQGWGFDNYAAYMDN